jgi:hypothetical protein
LPIIRGAHDFRLIVHDELVLLDRRFQLLGREALARLDVSREQGFDVFEHRRLLQRAEHLQAERFAELTRARQHTRVHAAGEQDAGRRALAREIAQRLDAVHAGHLQIEQDQRRLAFCELVPKRGGRVRGDDIAPDAFADLLDELEKVDFVVDRQNQIPLTPGHVATPLSRRGSHARGAPSPPLCTVC